MAIRGTVASIRCDQRSNAELRRAFNEINFTKVNEKLLANKCDFLLTVLQRVVIWEEQSKDTYVL